MKQLIRSVVKIVACNNFITEPRDGQQRICDRRLAGRHAERARAAFDGGYALLENLGQIMETAVLEVLQKKGLNYRWYRKGSMFCLFFTEKEVHNLQDAKTSDLVAFRKFFHYCLDHGVYFAPSQFETGFISMAHSRDDLEQTAEVAAAALAAL